MIKRKIFYKSKDEITNINAIKWIPDGNIKAVLQISHGMKEFIERYDEFAIFMAHKGYLVTGNDHLGHGDSITTKKKWGYFCKDAGSDVLIEDLHELRNIIQKEYKDAPYFMLGHSMGSFILRKYITKYGQGLSGVIIMGTGIMPNIVLRFGKCLAKFMSLFKGWYYRSEFLNEISMGNYDEKFKDPRKKGRWMTKEVDILDSYNHDPRCNYIFTLNGYYNLFDLIYYNNQHQNLKLIPKTLPVFIMSGEQDPVGNMGKNIKELYKQYKQLGIEDVTWKLYEDDRHEILNETDRINVFNDIQNWIAVRLAN